MNYDVEINNRQQQLEIDIERLRQMAELTLREEHVESAQVSVAIVDNSTIRELNKRYLDHDHETDVLSFLLECRTLPPEQRPLAQMGRPRRGAGKQIEGEVVLGGEVAAAMAEAFDWSTQEELLLYLVHGLLHLAGYDDQSASERLLMRTRERSILGILNLTPRHEDDVHGQSDESDWPPDRLERRPEAPS